MPINPSRLVLSVVLITTLSPGLSSVFAQTGITTGVSLTPFALAPITPAQRDRMSRSVVAVQTVTLLRDRGVLDEAQRERVATLERELAAALAARDAAVAGSSTQAQGRLEQARTAFDAEVTTLVAANQGLLREIEALRDSLKVTLPTLTDEEVRLRQRFADGDRVGTRAIMEKLDADWDAAVQLSLERAQAELARTTNLQRAARKRDAAQRAAVSVSKGDAGATSLQVLDLWDQAAALAPSDFWTHIERARLAQTIGNLPRARAAAEDGVRAAGGDLERGVALGELGEIALLQGDLATAAEAFGDYLELSQGWVDASPSDRELKRNLFISLVKYGSFEVASGNLTGASTSYNESLAIARQLSAGDPSSAVAQRDLSVSLERVGDVAVVRGDLAGASAAYNESMVITRRLLAGDPSSVQAQRNVSTSIYRVGDVAVARGDLASAGAAYSESLAINRRISAGDPSSAVAQRDVSFSLSRLGNVAVANGDLAGASAAYNEILSISRRLSEHDPSSALAQRDVSISLEKIGNVAVARGDLASASTAYNESLVIARGLWADNSSSAEARRDVGVSMAKLAQLPGASISWAQVVAHLRAMKRDGVLAPLDEKFLTASEELAAQEARGTLAAAAPAKS